MQGTEKTSINDRKISSIIQLCDAYNVTFLRDKAVVLDQFITFRDEYLLYL